jgi:lipopolysaccharide/colanic/teichoic acid biosynthesis glycosyltransferase
MISISKRFLQVFQWADRARAGSPSLLSQILEEDRKKDGRDKGPSYTFDIPFILGRLNTLTGDDKSIAKILGFLGQRKITSNPAIRPIFARKYLDISFALGLILPYLFFYSLTAVLYCGRRETVIYSQTRFGLNQKPFRVYKFTSMVKSAETISSEECLKKSLNDPRILGFWGRYLRSTSLNELPQLRNVLLEDMTLFGPRAYPIATHNKMVRIGAGARHKVRPGWISLSHVLDYNNNMSIEGMALMDGIYAELAGTSLRRSLDILTFFLSLQVIFGRKNK